MEYVNPITIAIAQFLLTFASLAVTGIWRMSRLETEILTHADILVKGYTKELTLEFDNYREKHEAEMAAIRNGLNEVKVWARDEFVRVREFYPIIESLKSDIKILGDKLDIKMIRIEDKIDKLKN